MIQLRGSANAGRATSSGSCAAGVGRAPTRARDRRAPAARRARRRLQRGRARSAWPPGSACRRGRRPTRSTSGVSCSWPMAETTGVRALGDGAARAPRPRTGSRSSTLPPPRASTITSTSGSASSVAQGGRHDRPRRRRPARPSRRSGTRTAGCRRVAVSTTSRLAAASLPQTSPIDAGQERQRPLALGGEQALGGEPHAHLLDPAQQLAEAELLDRVRPEAELALRLPQLAAAERVDAVADDGRGLILSKRSRCITAGRIRAVAPSGRK